MVQQAFELEKQILLLVQDHMRNVALTPVMKGITMLGDMGVVWILISIGLWLSKRWRKTGVAGIGAVGLECSGRKRRSDRKRVLENPSTLMYNLLRK